MRPMKKKLIFQVQFDQEISPYKGRHEQNIYVHKYLQFREMLINNLEEFITVDVIPKEPPKYYGKITSKKGMHMYHDTRRNKLVHFPRRDSFQVSVDNFVLFSRLQQGGWPNVEAITEWALRVSSKLMDAETDELQNMKKTIQIDKSKKSYKQQAQAVFQNQAIEQKLPPIRQSQQIKSRQGINYTTLQSKPHRYGGSSGRRTPVREQNNTIDLQTTKYFRRPSRSISVHHRQPHSPRENIYYADSRQKYKGSSFHWNIGAPRNIQIGNSTVQVNEENPHKDAYRNKNVELVPLTNEARAQRDKSFSEKAKMKQQQKIEKIEVTISDSSLNSFRHLYQIDGNKIRKLSNNTNWSYLLCENILPLKGQYYFSFSVIRSQQNNIQIGVAPLSYYPKFDQKQNQGNFICFNCHDGTIKDTKQDQLAIETKWRMGGQSLPKDTPCQMRVAFDMQNGYIDWYCEDRIIGSTKVPRLFYQGFRVVLGMLNVGDSVLLNQEDWKDRLRLSKFDKISYVIDPPSPKRSEDANYYRSEVQKKQVELSDFGQLSEVPKVDSSIQVNFVGRIHRQRIAKYMKNKVDEGLQTDDMAQSRKYNQPDVMSERDHELHGKVIKQHKFNKMEEKRVQNKSQVQGKPNSNEIYSECQAKETPQKEQKLKQILNKQEVLVETSKKEEQAITVQQNTKKEQKIEERAEQRLNPLQHVDSQQSELKQIEDRRQPQPSIKNPEEIKWNASFDPHLGYHLVDEQQHKQIENDADRPIRTAEPQQWHQSQSSHHTLPEVRQRTEEDLVETPEQQQPSDVVLDKLETTLQGKRAKQSMQQIPQYNKAEPRCEGEVKWDAYYTNNIYMLELAKQ